MLFNLAACLAIAFLLLASQGKAIAISHLLKSDRPLNLTTWKPQPTTHEEPSILKESPYNFDLKRAVSHRDPANRTIVGRARKDGTGKVPLWTYDEMRLMIDVKINNQQFKLIFDTGSSETWVADKTIECISPATAQLAECRFGDLFVHDERQSSEPSGLVFHKKYSRDIG